MKIRLIDNKNGYHQLEYRWFCFWRLLKRPDYIDPLEWENPGMSEVSAKRWVSMIMEHNLSKGIPGKVYWEKEV